MKVDIYYMVRYIRENAKNYKSAFFNQFVGDGVMVFCRRGVSLPTLLVRGQYYCFMVDPVYDTKANEEAPGKMVDGSGYIEDEHGIAKPYFVVSDNWFLDDWKSEDERRANLSPEELTRQWEEYFHEQEESLTKAFLKNGWKLDWSHISHM